MIKAKDEFEITLESETFLTSFLQSVLFSLKQAEISERKFFDCCSPTLQAYLKSLDMLSIETPFPIEDYIYSFPLHLFGEVNKVLIDLGCERVETKTTKSDRNFSPYIDRSRR